MRLNDLLSRSCGADVCVYHFVIPMGVLHFAGRFVKTFPQYTAVTYIMEYVGHKANEAKEKLDEYPNAYYESWPIFADVVDRLYSFSYRFMLSKWLMLSYNYITSDSDVSRSFYALARDFIVRIDKVYYKDNKYAGVAVIRPTCSALHRYGDVIMGGTSSHLRYYEDVWLIRDAIYIARADNYINVIREAVRVAHCPQLKKHTTLSEFMP